MNNKMNNRGSSRVPFDYNRETQSPVPSRGLPGSNVTAITTSFKPSPNLNLGKISFLGFIFFIQFSAFNGIQNLIVLIFHRLGLSALGMIALMSFYLFYGMSSTIAPALSIALSYRYIFTLCCGSFALMMFYFRQAVNCIEFEANDILTDNIFKPSSQQCREFYLYLGMIAVAALAGIGASVLWAAQGSYVVSCTTPLNKPKMLGRFWSFVQGSQLVGNFFASLLYKKYGPGGLLDVMFGVLVLAIFLCLFVRDPEKINDEIINSTKVIEFAEFSHNPPISEFQFDDDSETNFAEDPSRKLLPPHANNNHPTRTTWTSTLAFSVQERFKVFIPLFLISSYSMCVYVSFLSYLTEESTIELSWDARIEKIGYILFILGLFIVLSGQTFSYLCENDRVLAVKLLYASNFLACISMLIAYLTNIYWLFFIAAALFGTCDSGSQTVMRILLAIKFSDKLEPFAAFRWLWCSSLSLFFFMNIWLLDIGFTLSCLIYLILLVYGIMRMSGLFLYR